MESKVAAVVVTYNRIDLLMECLEAINNQTQKPDYIIVIDNASTDSTQEKLKEKGYLEKKEFINKRMKKNLGGAGGFYEGIKTALTLKCDWIWVMDDDTIPEKSCLFELLSAEQKIADEVSFFASYVEGAKNEPMNVPAVNNKPTMNGYSDWYKYLDYGIVKIRNATFVSILLNRKAVEKCGLPCKDYFLWGDDTEYTLRLNRYYGNAFFVGKSKVCHKRILTGALSLKDEEQSARIRNYYYYYRNSLVNIIKYNGVGYGLLHIVYRLFIEAPSMIRKKRGIKKFGIVWKGTMAGILHYRYFKKYINGQLES